MNNLSALPLKSAWLVYYTLFVIYGSLVPLHFQPQDLIWAWDHFLHTTMLKLGEASRADWIANGVLFFPIGILLTERLSGRTLSGNIMAALAGMLVIFMLAVGIEFTQIFFPGRTVSLNDILSESIGGTLGLLVGFPARENIRALINLRFADGKQGMKVLLKMYMAAYLAYSFFPYDFLLSSHELAEKIASNNWGILLAGSEEGLNIKSVAMLALEVIASVPFGIFLCMGDSSNKKRSTSHLVTAGLMLGSLIETIQFFTYSGISQGLSVPTRMLGVMAGGYLATRIDWESLSFDRRRFQTFLLPATLAYVALLTGMTAWTYRPWGGFDTAIEAIRNLHFLPFYYHYFTTEMSALISVVLIALLYSPLGIMAWISDRPRIYSIQLPLLLATLDEGIKLFSTSAHADPTNILIAVASAWTTAIMAERLIPSGSPLAVATLPPIKQEISSSEPPPPPRLDSPSALPPAKAMLLVLVATGCAYWLIDFPVQQWLLFAVYMLSGLVIWLRPAAALLIVPAALPILDLAPWSGRFFLDEFDWLLAITLVVGYLRTLPRPLPAKITLLLSLLLLSTTISTVLALLPWQTLDINAFNNYFSHYNALRISKGLLWALMFIGLATRLQINTEKSFQWFAWGMAIGLAETVLIMLREKMMFGGLFDFTSDYRATGPFSEIHTGGAYIECYLSVTVPFLIYLSIHSRNWLLKMMGILLLIGSTYTLIETVSRNGFAAYAMACLVALATAFIGPNQRVKKLMQATLFAGIAIMVAIPLFHGQFVQERMSHIDADFQTRWSHWQDALSIRDDTLMTNLFGMGVGRYPDVHYWRTAEKTHTSTYIFRKENGNTHLRIAPGNTIYFEQIVPVESMQTYILGIDTRSHKLGTSVGIALCEKWMLASARCATWKHSPVVSQPDTWQHYDIAIESGQLGSGKWLSQRPVKLSFFSTGKGPVDIYNISLTNQDRKNLISNGTFSKGMDHWFFSTDEHLAWHTKSMPLAMFFDQGWFGLFAYGSFLTIMLVSALRSALMGNHMAGTLAASSLAFLVVGIFDTLIDSPRFLFLIVVLASFAAGWPQNSDPIHNRKLNSC